MCSFGGERGGQGERFVGQRVDRRADQRHRRVETRAGPVQHGIEIKRPVQFQLDRMDLRGGIAVPLQDMPPA